MFSWEGNGKHTEQSRTGFLEGEREKEQSEYFFFFLVVRSLQKKLVALNPREHVLPTGVLDFQIQSSP